MEVYLRVKIMRLYGKRVGSRQRRHHRPRRLIGRLQGGLNTFVEYRAI